MANNSVFVATGPITGSVVVDGVEIDVTNFFVPADDQDHAMKIAAAIGARYEAEGHPTVDNFVVTDNQE